MGASLLALAKSIYYYIYFSKTIPRKNVYLCIAALYINTAVSFKSNMTKICYCWPPILYFRSYNSKITSFCISGILRILVCDMVAMPGTLIPFAVTENLTGHS